MRVGRMHLLALRAGIACRLGDKPAYRDGGEGALRLLFGDSRYRLSVVVAGAAAADRLPLQ